MINTKEDFNSKILIEFNLFNINIILKKFIINEIK